MSVLIGKVQICSSFGFQIIDYTVKKLLICVLKAHAAIDALTPANSIIIIHPSSTAATTTGAIMAPCTTAHVD